MELKDAIALSDHQDGLDVLYKHVLEKARTVPEGIPFVEIGTRSGGTALLILLAIKNSRIFRPLFTVDPYGNKPYNRGNKLIDLDYGETFYRGAMYRLATYCKEEGLFHHHLRMLSTDFIKVFSQIDFWHRGKVLDTSKFGFVYLDGDHEETCIANELSWFLPKMVPEGLIVIDDAEYVYNSKVPIISDFVQGAYKYVNSRLYYDVLEARQERV